MLGSGGHLPGGESVVDMLGGGALRGVAGAALADELDDVRRAAVPGQERAHLLPHLVRLRDLPRHHLPQQDAQAEDVDLHVRKQSLSRSEWGNRQAVVCTRADAPVMHSHSRSTAAARVEMQSAHTALLDFPPVASARHQLPRWVHLSPGTGLLQGLGVNR